MGYSKRILFINGGPRVTHEYALQRWPRQTCPGASIVDTGAPEERLEGGRGGADVQPAGTPSVALLLHEKLALNTSV